MRQHFEAVPDDIGKAVRLGFHHCVGGCDGCIALESNLNRGLKEYILEQERITGRHISYSRNLWPTFFAQTCN